MLPEDIGLASSSLPLGKHSGRAALRDKLKGLGYDDVGENQLKDVFVRFKALADRKKEVYDDDIIALMQVVSGDAINERIKLKFLRVICGTEAPQSADINLTGWITNTPRPATARWTRHSTRSRRCSRPARGWSCIKCPP